MPVQDVDKLADQVTYEIKGKSREAIINFGRRQPLTQKIVDRLRSVAKSYDLHLKFYVNKETGCRIIKCTPFQRNRRFMRNFGETVEEFVRVYKHLMTTSPLVAS